MAERSRRLGSLVGYGLVSVLGAAAGFGGVQLAAGADDEVPVSSAPVTTDTTASSTTTTTVPVEVIAVELADVETVDDALELIARAPAAPDPGVSVTLADSAEVGEVAGSTAFLVSSADLAELGPPFLPASDGSAPKLPGGEKIVVMVALSELVAAPDGLVATVVYEQPGQPAETTGPFAGTTSAVVARLGRSDVIGSVANADATFTENAPAGSVRVDGPLLTFVVDPVAPFRVVFARGFDSSLDNFGINPAEAGPTLTADQLERLGDVDALVTELVGG